MPHLAGCSPTDVAVAGVSKICVCARLISAGEIELRSKLVRNALVLNEAVLARRSDGLLIEALGLQFPAFDAGYLGADQCRAVLEILGALLRPGLDMGVVGYNRLPILEPLLERCRVVLCRPRERVIEKVFKQLKNTRTTDFL